MATKTPHRPKRDERKARELSDLKSENNQLRRAVSRLRKELDQQENFQLEAMDTNELYGIPDIKECPKCESIDILIWQSPKGAIFNICKKCKYKLVVSN